MLNEEVARKLDEIAQIVEAGGGGPFRSRAYHRGAETMRHLREPVAALVERGGTDALETLPGIGAHLATVISTLVRTGQSPMLERLRRKVTPEALLRTVPGVGRTLARRLVGALGIESLEDLEAAAHDGRLSDVLGLPAKTIAGIADSLAVRLARVRPALSTPRNEEPGVEDLLDIDREYRERAARGELPAIAPRRFNPAREAWLPVMHTRRHGRAYTALFSNTALAHQLGATHDWVVIYATGCPPGAGQQWTVVTETSGSLAGQRVVRGRELEQSDAVTRAERLPGSASPCTSDRRCERT